MAKAQHPQIDCKALKDIQLLAQRVQASFSVVEVFLSQVIGFLGYGEVLCMV